MSGKGKRGFSSVVGSVFMVLIMSVLASSYFVYTLSQNTAYNTAVGQKNQLDQSVKSENLKSGNTTYTSYPNTQIVNVNANVTNIGSTSVQFIRLWLCVSNYTSASIPWTGYQFISLTNVNIQPGQTYLPNYPYGLNLTVSGFISTYNDSYSYASWLVTSRGNTVALQTQIASSNVVLNAKVSQGIGYLAMDFEQFKYFTFNTTTTLANFPTGSPGYNPPKAQSAVFRVNLTNFDPSGLKRTLTLNKNSLLWLYFPTVGQVATWYIANIDASGRIQPTYSDITVPYGVDNSVIVYFASKSCGTFAGNPDQVNPGSVGPAAINLLLLGLIGGEQYGQNIPFVSVYCS